MAENAIKAFGRYLKTLRERRGLSLYDVCSLSRTFAENLNKGYLSRCENGHQKLAFPKVVPLSRIYEVPADVLVERMELDLELDRVGGPDTETPSFEEMSRLWKETIDKGYRWKAYAYARDAIPRALDSPIVDTYESCQEQLTCTQMNCGTSALGLGKTHFSLHEFSFLREKRECRPRYASLLLERMSICHRLRGDNQKAMQCIQTAITETEESGDSKYLGYLYECRATTSHEDSDLEGAAEYFHRAYSAHQAHSQMAECAITLNNLGHCYFELRRFGAARRALQGSLKISHSLGQEHIKALAQILLGEIDEAECMPDRAAKRWKTAADIARRLNNKTLRFQAEFPLYRHARKSGNEQIARSIERRLRLLAPGVPDHLSELKAFRRMQLTRATPELSSDNN